MERFNKIAKSIIIITLTLAVISSISFEIYLFVTKQKPHNPDYIIYTTMFLIVFIWSESFFKKRFSYISSTYYYIAAFFAFLSLYLGSFNDFYELFGWWDVVLHFSSGILLGFLGIIVVDVGLIYYTHDNLRKFDFVVIIICGVLLSISFAVFWELYEFFYDYISDGNMQRSLIVTNPETFDIKPYLRPSGRFVDPGLKDTMEDMILAVVGALIAAIISYIKFMRVDVSKKNNIDKEEKNEQ